MILIVLKIFLLSILRLKKKKIVKKEKENLELENNIKPRIEIIKSENENEAKKNPAPSSSVLLFESSKTTSSIHLELESTYLQNVPDLYFSYFKICTFFSNRKKKGKVLNLLPEMISGSSIKNNDKNVLEINFSKSFDEKEIFILLGCFHLCLLNVAVQPLTNFWKVKLKFFSDMFQIQKKFLLKIQPILSHI
jgi:hypothetical protein